MSPFSKINQNDPMRQDQVLTSERPNAQTTLSFNSHSIILFLYLFLKRSILLMLMQTKAMRVHGTNPQVSLFPLDPERISGAG